MKLRLKVRAVGQEWQWWLIGGPPAGSVLAQIAVTIPMILGFDLELMRGA